jgi:hypothetical protein
VVGGVDHDRVLEAPAGVERREQPGDLVVQQAVHAVVGGQGAAQIRRRGVEGAHVLRRAAVRGRLGGVRRVRLGVGQGGGVVAGGVGLGEEVGRVGGDPGHLQEERRRVRAVFEGIEEAEGVVRDHGVHVVLGRPGDDGAHLGGALRRRAGQAVVPAVGLTLAPLGQVVGDVEAARAAVASAVEVAAAAGDVAGPLQALGQGQFVRVQGAPVAAHAVGVGVAPGEQGAAGGEAEGLGDEAVPRPGAPGGEGVQRRGAAVRVAVEGEAGGLLLVGHQEQQVGASRSGGRHGRTILRAGRGVPAPPTRPGWGTPNGAARRARPPGQRERRSARR